MDFLEMTDGYPIHLAALDEGTMERIAFMSQKR